jgi:hypothetical protein
MSDNPGSIATAVYALLLKLETAGCDSVRVLELEAQRMVMGLDTYGPLKLATDRRDWKLEQLDEWLDGRGYSNMATLTRASQSQCAADSRADDTVRSSEWARLQSTGDATLNGIATAPVLISWDERDCAGGVTMTNVNVKRIARTGK